MLSDSTLRLKFVSHTVGRFWSAGGMRVFNHQPEGHGYSFLLPHQYVFSLVKGGYGENTKHMQQNSWRGDIHKHDWISMTRSLVLFSVGNSRADCLCTSQMYWLFSNLLWYESVQLGLWCCKTYAAAYVCRLRSWLYPHSTIKTSLSGVSHLRTTFIDPWAYSPAVLLPWHCKLFHTLTLFIKWRCAAVDPRRMEHTIT